MIIQNMHNRGNFIPQYTNQQKEQFCQTNILQTFHFQTGLHAFCLQKKLVFTHHDYFMQAASIKLT